MNNLSTISLISMTFSLGFIVFQKRYFLSSLVRLHIYSASILLLA